MQPDTGLALAQGGVIKLLGNGVQAGDAACAIKNKVTGFVFQQLVYIIAMQGGAVPAFKKILKPGTVEAGQPFAGAKPHKAAAILEDGLNGIIGQPVGGTVRSKMHRQWLGPCPGHEKTGYYKRRAYTHGLNIAVFYILYVISRL